MGELRTVTGAQFTMMLLVSYLTAGIFTFPREIVREAGNSGIYSLLLATTLAYGGAMLIAWVGSHFPGLTGVQWGDEIIPYRIHRVLTVLAAGVHLVVTPTVVREFTMLLRETFFQETPGVYLMLGLVLVAGYGASQGVEVLGRVCVITVPVLILTLVVAYLLGYPHFEIYRVHPVDPHGAGILRGTFSAVLIYEGYASLFLLQGHLARPERVFRYVTYSFLISTAIFVIIYIATMATFGHRGVTIITWPAPLLLLLVRLRGWFTERLGLFVEVAWAGLVLLYAAIHLWATGLATQQVLGLKPRSFTRIIAVLMVAFMVIGLIPASIEHVAMVFDYLSWGVLYTNLGLGAIQWGVGMVRGSFRRRETPTGAD